MLELRVYPRLQEQLLGSVLPAGENEYAGQPRHSVEAETFENVPLGHRRHGDEPFAALNLPGLHALQVCPPVLD